MEMEIPNNENLFLFEKRKNNRKSKHCEALKAEEHEEEIHQYSQLICCLRHQNKEEGHNFIPRRFSYLWLCLGRHRLLRWTCSPRLISYPSTPVNVSAPLTISKNVSDFLSYGYRRYGSKMVKRGDGLKVDMESDSVTWSFGDSFLATAAIDWFERNENFRSLFRNQDNKYNGRSNSDSLGWENKREREPTEHHILRTGVHSPDWCYSPVCFCCGSEARNYKLSRNFRLVSVRLIYKQSIHHLLLCFLPNRCAIDPYNCFIDSKNKGREKKIWKWR